MIVNSEYYSIFTELYTQYKESTKNLYKEGRLILTVSDQTNAEAKLSEKLDIYTEETNKLSINLITELYRFFFDKKSFLKDSSKIKLDKDFAIIQYSKDSFLFYSCIDKLFYELNPEGNLVYSDNNLFVDNAIYYEEILDLMKEKLALYNATANRELVITFVSGAEPPFLIGYPSLKEELPNCNLKLVFNSFNDELARKDFAPFFKNQICQIISETKKHDRYIDFLRKYDLILKSANLDFEIYLKDFSFDKIRTKFRENRDKYFQSIQEINSKLSSKSGALVVAVSASVFATLKISNDKNSLSTLIVLSVYSLYCLYSCVELIYIREELLTIKFNFDKELIEIQEQSSKIYNILEEDSRQILKRISKTTDRLPVLYTFLTLFNLLVFGFIFLQTYNFSFLDIYNQFIVVTILLLFFLLLHCLIWIGSLKL